MDVAIFATASAALVAAAHVASSKRQSHSAALKEAAAAKASALEAAATGSRHTHAVLPGAEPGEVVIHPIDHIKRRFPDAATFERLVFLRHASLRSANTQWTDAVEAP
jgi:hypothetical protein